jgi:anti-anti-sigma factor
VTTAVSQLAHLHFDDRSGVTVANIEGEIDLSNAAELELAISHAVRNDARAVVVNLTHVEYLDSSGVSLLFNLARRLSRRQQAFVVVAPAEAHVREILSLSGAEALALHNSLTEALSRLNADSHGSGL